VAFQVDREFGGGRVALPGLLAQGLEEDGVEIAAQLAAGGRGPLRLLLADGARQRLGAGIGQPVGPASGEELVEDDPE
jgi:hypothetical protein